jgi:hypothetical protein
MRSSFLGLAKRSFWLYFGGICLLAGVTVFVAAGGMTLGTVFGGIGGFLVVRAVLGLLRTHRLLRSGVAVEATVTVVEQTNVSFNRRQQFRVRYTYRDQQGGRYEGDSGYLDWEEASRWKDGDRAAISYDARRPSESQWIGTIEAPAPFVDAPPPFVDLPFVDAPPPP